MSANEKKNNFWQYRGIGPSEIPNVDVYMDQLLAFFDKACSFLRRDRKESVLTKAMINNYVKAGIMDKPNKKKYNQDQVKKLIMIYHLKQVLAFNDIETLLRQAEKTSQSTCDFYQKFSETEAEVYAELAGRYPENGLEETDDQVLLDTVVSLAIEACAKKRLAEKLLDKLRNGS